MVHWHGAYRSAVSGTSSRPRRGCDGDIRTWLAHRVAHASTWATLIVIAGCGRVQRAGGPIEDIRPGDVVWFARDEKHWHGASPTTAMTHIAIQEKLNGKAVEWMEHVTDEQYNAK